MIYLDHHSATTTCTAALDRMKAFSEEHFASPSSPTKMGQDIVFHLEQAYSLIYDFVGADYEDGFVFTSSGREAVFHTLFSIYHDVITKEGKTHIIALKSEDASILLTLKKLEELGCILHMLDVNEDGLIDIEQLKKAINPRTSLMSLSWASGLTGVIQPIDEIAEICKEHNILLHVDASYILGKIFLPLNDLPITYMTFSGNMIHGPKSSGGIFMKKGHELVSLANMAGMQSADLDAASLMALSAACQKSILSMDLMTMDVAILRSNFEKEIQSRIANCHIFYQNRPRLPNVSCMAFDKVHSEALIYELNKNDVIATFGGGNMQHLSNLFQGGLSHSAVSFAMSRYTTEEQVCKAAEVIEVAVANLRKISGAL